MISSGMKRGLAVSAVSALAIAGVPLLASSANAAAGDSIAVVSTGPALNGGAVGAVVVLKTKGIDEGDLALASTTSAAVDSQNNSEQSASIVGRSIDVNPKGDGFDVITLNIETTTATTGDAASFRVFEDEGGPGNGTLDASEARANVSVSTSGPLAAISVDPASQSVAQGISTGDYTVTLKDAAGRTTQLAAGDTVGVTTDGAAGLTVSDSTIDEDEAATGTATFKASTTVATPVGAHPLTLTDADTATIKGAATVNVTPAANISSSNQVDIVTGADSWDGFGGGSLGGTTAVRVDQSSVRIDVKGGNANANGTVTLNVSSANMTFGGKGSTTVTTVLDAAGNGSLTITPDAFTVQDGDSLTIGGSFNQTIDFERAAPDAVEASADPYFGKLLGSVDVTAVVVDQFGDPYTAGFIGGAVHTGSPNYSATATPQIKPVGTNGETTLTFTDTKAANGQSDTIDLAYYVDQFSNSPDAFGGTHIKWTTDGQGANFKTLLDTQDTEAANYDPSKVTVVPLADTDADNSDESIPVAVNGAEANSTVTVSVDNGALILEPGKFLLSEGKSSVTYTLTGGATDLPAGYRVVGTKSGLVTVTVSAANRTETAQYTVTAQTDRWTSRNVTVSGPAEVEHGTTQIPFTAVVTDAFGNPVANVPVSDLNIQVTGPAQFQDSDALTNAAGQINLNVRVDADAEGVVAIKVQGLDDQFGAAADQLWLGGPADNGKGLPASSNVANASTTVQAAPPVVEPKGINLKLTGKNNGKKDDKLKANANKNAAGLKAVLYKGNKKVASHKLNANGDYTFTVKDTNGAKKTKYTVKVAATDTTKAGKASKSVK